MYDAVIIPLTTYTVNYGERYGCGHACFVTERLKTINKVRL